MASPYRHGSARAKLLELTLLRTEGAVSERPLSSVPDDNAEDTACLGKGKCN